MSMFESGQYRWRETYFVMFPSAKRPTLRQLDKALSGLSHRYTLTNLNADEDGLFESATLLAPDDFAALDICYVDGDEVLEQGEALVKEMRGATSDAVERAKLQRITRFDGRLDVLHFEQVDQENGDEDLDEMLDPGALLVVLDALVKLCDGVAIDPQSGTIL